MMHNPFFFKSFINILNIYFSIFGFRNKWIDYPKIVPILTFHFYS